MIRREHYIEQIREFYDSDLIKIITGIRRCGKSVILEQVMNEIKMKSDNVIYLNFEDKKILNKIGNGEGLLDYVESNRKKGKCYVFLDEIQLLDNYVDAVKTLRLHDNSVFITGSNSKILSKEFTKDFSGRYAKFRIKPFVYKEILEYSKELNKECNIIDYLVWGGFPKRFEFDSEEARYRYLADLEETIVINDLITRFKIKKIELFKSLVDFIFQSNSRIISAKSIKDYIKHTHETCSVNTIIKYIEYLEEAYIIEKIRPYSTKKKETLKYYFKVYNEDVMFNSLRVVDNRYDLTHNLENVIYNELIYMGYNINVYNDSENEIDFLAHKDGKKYYIQVAFSVEDSKVYDREFKPFSKLDNSCKKILITNDELDYSTSVVTHIKLKDFLLMEDLDS
jgi:predicted AAA+ superfamily ATPase